MDTYFNVSDSLDASPLAFFFKGAHDQFPDFSHLKYVVTLETN